MTPRFLRIALPLLLLAPAAQAGTLADGRWTPSTCGTEPPPVALDTSSVDAFNKSIPAVKAWQDKAKAYSACLVGEANADNAAIVKAVNDAQGRIKDQFDRVNAQGQAAQAKFGGAKATPGKDGGTTAPGAGTPPAAGQ